MVPMRGLLAVFSMAAAGSLWWPSASAEPITSATVAPGPSKPSVTVTGKTHTIFAWNNLSGEGATIPGLANTYDMSLLEWNWGGKQSTFNGAGITTNSNFPLTEGEAISNNTHLGYQAQLRPGLETGLLWQFYTVGGNRTVGRVYGEELPWDNFHRLSSTSVVQEHFSTDIFKAWLKDTEGPLTSETVFGNVIPELTRQEINYLRLGSLLYRPPVTNASFFEKEDRKIETGRHPLRGVDTVVDYEYADGQHVHVESFLGRTKPTPVQEIDRDVVGARLGSDIGEGNAGVTFVRTEGERNPSITGERQNLWALDGSYDLAKALALFGVWGHTVYTRTTGTFRDNAWVGGARLLGPGKTELKAQYQWVGEDYELMGHHKTEHYPSNFHGPNVSLTVPVGRAMALKGIIYQLHQIETATNADDTVFGDSFLPSVSNSERGDITMWRLGADYDFGKHHVGLPKLITYAEEAHFRKNAPDSANNDIDKTVWNLNALLTQPLTAGLNLELGLRHVIANGRWQAMRFHHRQTIPEVGVTYKSGKDVHATLLYHWYHFTDSTPASLGRNNYEAQQILCELFVAF